MRVVGFSIANRAVELGYPIAASLRSMLPLVDELVLNIGESDDRTWNLVESLREPKIKPFRSYWDPNMRFGGEVLAKQTNLALARCQGDWGLYLQADEVLHEKDYPVIRAAMEKQINGPAEALRFRYHHFYGSFNTVQDYPRRWYTRAARAVRLRTGVTSWGDAMDFCLERDGRRWFLRHADIDAYIHHYGWARPPHVMRAKRTSFERLYHEDDDLPVIPEDIYYERGNLRYFRGTHPAAMRETIASQHWDFDHGIERQPPDWLRHALVWSNLYLHRAGPFAAKWAQRIKRRILH
jgi:hypothetical protein